MGYFKGYFEGAKTFLTPKLSRAQPGPLRISREMAHKVVCPKTKNNIPNFQNQRYIVNFMSHCDNCPLTINVPLILKMREIIFCLRENYFMGHFKGYFEGVKKGSQFREEHSAL
jgi:hypothetical protein